MSCDENHEARAQDRLRRSLPVVRENGGKKAATNGATSGQQGALEATAAPKRRYWTSLADRDRIGAAPGAANEFPGGAGELDGVSRRGFMQLLGVSTAVATVGAACQKPREKIIPFVRRPEEVTPGNALHFATA